jgi:hypothetical protein
MLNIYLMGNFALKEDRWVSSKAGDWQDFRVTRRFKDLLQG